MPGSSGSRHCRAGLILGRSQRPELRGEPACSAAAIMPPPPLPPTTDTLRSSAAATAATAVSAAAVAAGRRTIRRHNRGRSGLTAWKNRSRDFHPPRPRPAHLLRRPWANDSAPIRGRLPYLLGAAAIRRACSWRARKTAWSTDFVMFGSGGGYFNCQSSLINS